MIRLESIRLLSIAFIENTVHLVINEDDKLESELVSTGLYVIINLKSG